MISQRKVLLPLDPLCPSFEKLLLLAPKCCQLSDDVNIDGNFVQWNHFKHKQSLYGKYYAYLCDARNKIAQCQKACSMWSNNYNGDDEMCPSTGNHFIITLLKSWKYIVYFRRKIGQFNIFRKK